jgi:hypothetical protein
LGFCPTSTTSWSIEGRLIVHLYDAQKWLREKKLLHIVIDKLLYGAYEFSIVDILNYSEEKKTVQLILMKKPFPKVSRRLLKF